MRNPLGTALAWATLVLPTPSLAQSNLTTIDEEELTDQRPPPSVSVDLLDPGALTRFHLVTRARFAPDSAWTFEPTIMVRVADGIALGARVPLAIDAAIDGGEQFLLGNVRLSGAGGFFLPVVPGRDGLTDPRFSFGLGLDLYLPTQTEPGRCGARATCDSAVRVRELRAYEPALYVSDATFARGRAQVTFSAAGFRLSVEAGVSPGWYVKGPFEGEAVVLYGWGARMAYDVLGVVEPFVELVGSGDVQSPDLDGVIVPVIDPGPRDEPIHFTFGARGFYEGVAPALFATFVPDRGTFFFGLDVAGLLAPTARGSTRVEAIDF